eukprot:5129965-Heterocapsa_arctica.AAC.1
MSRQPPDPFGSRKSMIMRMFFAHDPMASALYMNMQMEKMAWSDRWAMCLGLIASAEVPV